MPLSDHEQRLLEAMERALYAEDPRFVSSLRNRSERSATRRRRATAVIVSLGALGVIVAGVATGIIAIGVVGFVLLVVAAWLLLSPASGSASVADAATTTPTAKKPKSSSGFFDRLEQRWDRRSETDES